MVSKNLLIGSIESLLTCFHWHGDQNTILFSLRWLDRCSAKSGVLGKQLIVVERSPFALYSCN